MVFVLLFSNGLATVYMTHGKYDKALKVYERWLKVEPDSQQVKAGLTKARAGLNHDKGNDH